MAKLWARSAAEVPPRWQIMDGTVGTLDVRQRVLVGADSDTGGAFSLGALGGSVSGHTHSVGSHDHTFAVRSGAVFETGTAAGLDLDTSVNLSHGGTDKVARAAHTHQSSGVVDGSGALSTGSTSSVYPPYRAYYWIQRVATA
jgi:hypothetical protein